MRPRSVSKLRWKWSSRTEAFRRWRKSRRHSVYDLYYAVLARREKAAVLTFDKRLKQLCNEMHIPLADA